MARRYARRGYRRRAGPRVYRLNGQLGQNQPGRGFIPLTQQTLETFGPSRRSASAVQREQRRVERYRGLGDYSSAWQGYRGYIPRALGAAAGGLTTRTLGGAAKGWGAGAAFSKNILGWGDYGPTVGNQIMGDGGGPISVNQAEGDLTGDVYLNHREFVMDIQSAAAGAFNVDLFRINPGLPAKKQSALLNKGAFPFLRQIAENFTLYEFQGLIFEYVPMSGETGQASNALGTVIMCTNYDPTELAFTSAQEMQNYDYANSGKPSVSLLHGVETKPSQQTVRMNYVSTVDPPVKDPIFTDLGTFQIATVGVPTAEKVGELWVTYRIKLSRAKLNV